MTNNQHTENLAGPTTAAPGAADRTQVLNDILNVSTHLIAMLDPDELVRSLVRRIVEVVPNVQAGLLWLPVPDRRDRVPRR